MPLVVRSVSYEDVPQRVRLRVACLGTLVIGHLPLYPGYIEHSEASIRNELQHTPHVHHLKVVDTGNEGEILAFAKWEVYERGRPDLQALQQPMKKEDKEVDGFGDLREAAHEYFSMSNSKIGKRPHLLLALLVTDKKHRRKGAGSLLVQWGIKMSEELGIPCYVQASEAGRSLYEHHGFQVVREVSFDLAKYGLRGLQIMTEMKKEPAAASGAKATD